MAKIVISDLHTSDTKTILHVLNTAQMSVIGGNSSQASWIDDLGKLVSIFDGVTDGSSTNPALSSYDNKIFAVDLSGLGINFMFI
ncbi:MAG: hypothetical protein KME21_16050 [Desmonostoc vinosum HA7617-LM4]|jgi:hypothetical protein|nr:hypothetical protein [Desmonostoc vinosum HA7617-LM4]